MGILDSVIALRVMYLLVLPFKKWPACKQGFIDEDGNILEHKKSSGDWTMLHRLVARVKKIISAVPGGKSIIGSMVAAYALVKEQYDNKLEYDDEALKEQFEFEYVNLTENDMKFGTEILEQVVEEFATGVSIVGGGVTPKNDKVEPTVSKKAQKKWTLSQGANIVKRKSYQDFINGS